MHQPHRYDTRSRRKGNEEGKHECRKSYPEARTHRETSNIKRCVQSLHRQSKAMSKGHPTPHHPSGDSPLNTSVLTDLYYLNGFSSSSSMDSPPAYSIDGLSRVNSLADDQSMNGEGGGGDGEAKTPRGNNRKMSDVPYITHQQQHHSKAPFPSPAVSHAMGGTAYFSSDLQQQQPQTTTTKDGILVEAATRAEMAILTDDLNSMGFVQVNN